MTDAPGDAGPSPDESPVRHDPDGSRAPGRTGAGDGADRPARSAPRGAAGRVAEIQRLTRPTLLLAAAFSVAAPVSAVAPHDTGAWLPLHLFLVGGLLLAISGATQFFAVTWATAPAPPAAWTAAQRWTLAAGAAGLAVARELDAGSAVMGIAGAAVMAALVILGALLVRIGRGAVAKRFEPSLHHYLAALGAGLAGCALGVVMAGDDAGAEILRWRDAHMTLNLLGLVGLVIAGTLPFFVATEARMKMAPGATPARIDLGLGPLAAGVVIGAAGFATEHPLVGAAGLATYGVGLIALVAILPTPRAKQWRWAGSRLVHLAAGLAWWIGAVGAAAARAATGREPFTIEVLLALVVGAYAQILVGSLGYLGPVLRGGGHVRLTAGFATTRSWLGLAAANGAGGALALGASTAGAVLLAVWVADSVARAAVLLAPAIDHDGPGAA